MNWKTLEKVIKIPQESMKTQLAETAKKNEFKSYLGQHVRKVAKLADVNKDIVVLGHEGEKKKKKKTVDGFERYNEDKK